MFDPSKKILELIKLQSENEVVEFKEANNGYDFKKIGKYFSALSNEANLRGEEYAWLVFGVRDKDHELINTDFRPKDADLQSLKGEIGNKVTAGITFTNIFAMEIEDNGKKKRAILFQIPAAPLGIPISFEGHYYARNHEELVPLNIDKIERIRIQEPRRDWSKNIIAEAKLADLSSEAILKARELYQQKHPHLSVADWTDEQFLNKAKVTIKSQITNTAILLLGKPESVHFISPAVSKISWILRDGNNIELDYEHFTSPLLLSVDKLYAKIRNLRYRYMQEGSLFPEEVYKYDPYVIREALNNCIAHQDYTLGGKINVVEKEDESLTFSNLGSFLPVRVENVIKSDAPSEFYRNRFLADAMVNLNMIDTIGSGIKKMFITQKNKFFPLPDYDLKNNQVTVTITGKVLDMNYARKLANIPDLSLDTIILLDRVQKKKPITSDEAKSLRQHGLIEGKRPNVYVSSDIASATGTKVEYMKRRGVDSAFCRQQILEYLEKFKIGTRYDFEGLLIDKLGDDLTLDQKKSKIKNTLQQLRRDEKITPMEGKTWKLKA